ncbi:MAG: F-type H+-transporting ATPase subunit b [Myxococcota bacterium]|jgi:F-type H+-transporting ATPase subunit b
MPVHAIEKLANTSELIQGAGVVDVDSSILFMLALYLVFFYLINKILLVPMRDVFEKRHALTAGARQDAAAAVKSAEAKLAEYTQKVGEARRQALLQAKAMRDEGSVAERKMLDEVREEATAQVAKGLSELQAEGTKAEAQLTATANETGERIAAQILEGGAA